MTEHYLQTDLIQYITPFFQEPHFLRQEIGVVLFMYDKPTVKMGEINHVKCTMSIW